MHHLASVRDRLQRLQAALDREHRRVIERLLSELGEEQMRLGRVNERTGMWVSAFRDWE